MAKRLPGDRAQIASGPQDDAPHNPFQPRRISLTVRVVTSPSIPQAEFVLSCPHVGLAPRRRLPEIAFAGRSNVGKSSLINSLLNRKKLALTAKTPGKTRLLNYYLIGRNLCYFVDLPGYGFARVSKSLQAEWGEYIEGYLRDSSSLRMVVLILDIRHGVTDLDEQMIKGFHVLGRSWIAALTKADKLSSRAAESRVAALHSELISRGARAVVPYSSLKHTGRADLLHLLLKEVGRP